MGGGVSDSYAVANRAETTKELAPG
jgi:hypothetical protein